MHVLRVGALIALFAVSTTVLAQDYVYVSSRGTHSVKRYEAATGAYIDDIVAADFTKRTLTQEVLFGEDGKLYVSFRRGPESVAIHRYDPMTGEDLGAFTNGYDLDEPTKMSWGPDGNLYVSQWGTNKWNVAVFDGQTGSFLGEATSEQSRLNLMDHAWDSDNNLLVVSFGSNAGGKDVRRYDSEGTYLGSLVAAFYFLGPVNLWFEEDGDLMVIDWGAGNGTGKVLRFNGQTGLIKSTLVSGLVHAEGFAVDEDGRLYVGDWGANFVYRYDSESGAFVDRFINTGGLIAPNSIVFGPPEVASVGFEGHETPDNFTLDQNYPNPFNPTTIISFSLKEASTASISVFDSLGREVARPLDEKVLPAGSHETSFEAANLASGTYLYQLKVEGQILSRTMTLVQ